MNNEVNEHSFPILESLKGILVYYMDKTVL
jgi:hypothetical protein